VSKERRGGEKVRKSILLLTLMAVVIALSIAPAMAPCPSIEVSKRLKCSTGPGYSDNPPYYVGSKYFFWIEIEVEAHVDLSSVVVFDRLGAELMIEGITVDEATMLAEDYDYDFDYMPYAKNGDVYINGVMEGHLNTAGVAFDGFTIFWTGNSVKVHFMWNVGAMDAGETAMIWLIVSTDTNPAGHQEYTSPGCYMLNSGATVKAILASTGKQVSSESESIWISVLED
jgi:hypothetical protein